VLFGTVNRKRGRYRDNVPMSLAAGTRLGPYEVLSAIGAGGMGEVYRARDKTLNRDVALKVVPDAFASDPDRLARFTREAQTLASLNHPHIAAIYGLEESNGLRALVMELVEGDDLSQRIANGPIPIDEALPIAKQIAEGLEAAHEQGVVHRDLKPANIKVRADGTVKVLDFGLAKAMEPTGAMLPSVSMSPTITTPAMMTSIGVILGTAAYMSPEQARRKVIDKRADIWAYGCVVFEMLTGTRLFEGATVSDTLAFVLTKEPDWTTLPASTPVPIRTLLRRCLEKERTRRLDSAAAARLEIDDALAPSAGTTTPTVASTRRLAFVAVASLTGGALATSLGVWMMMRPSTDRAALEMRFAILPPASQTLTINGADRALALSPDGSHLAYVSDNAAGTTQLMVRALNQLDAVALAGVTGIRSPFVSPDGQWVGFFAGTVSGDLKKVSIAGEPYRDYARASYVSQATATCS
jgi:eukaryotic-like serine/threonine-protein kinase